MAAWTKTDQICSIEDEEDDAYSNQRTPLGQSAEIAPSPLSASQGSQSSRSATNKDGSRSYKASSGFSTTEYSNDAHDAASSAPGDDDSMYETHATLTLLYLLDIYAFGTLLGRLIPRLALNPRTLSSLEFNEGD